MKRFGWIGLGMGVAVVLTAVIVMQVRHGAGPGSTSQSQGGDTKATRKLPKMGEIPWPKLPAVAVERPVAPTVETVSAQPGEATMQVVRLKPGVVLAVVNGKAITVGDLVPVRAAESGKEQTMSTEMYRQMLEQAVERELVMQAATAVGMDLSAAQQEQLEQMKAEMEKKDPNLVERLTMSAERVEFELRDAAARLLKEDLATAYGVPGKHVTSEMVQRYYAGHAGEFAGLPAAGAEREAAWQQIEVEIRTRLMKETRDRHQEELGKFMDQLKAGANIQLPEANAAGVASGG